jgi:three-Cys-motif partner protein
MSNLPEIQPHTAAKHLILKRYLQAWFPILGKYHSTINYIDGFAGPGSYVGGEEGSPIIAIRTAIEHLHNRLIPDTTTINFLFVDVISSHCKSLNEQINSLSLPKTFTTQVIHGEFRDTIGGILDRLEADDKKLAPTFMFVDPLGFGGIPFDLMRRILGYGHCEIFVNLMVGFINRFLEHPSDKIVRHFPETFGTEEVLRVPDQQGNRVQFLLSLYRSQLQKATRFIGRFDMRNRKDRQIYSLFFASNNAKGFQKMKEAMWSVDKAAGAMFSDRDPRGVFQFDLFGLDPLWSEMKTRYANQLVRMGELETWVVEETDYLPKHLREVLRERDTACEIEVVSQPGYKMRQGTFKVGRVSIRFKSA